MRDKCSSGKYKFQFVVTPLIISVVRVSAQFAVWKVLINSFRAPLYFDNGQAAG